MVPIRKIGPVGGRDYDQRTVYLVYLDESGDPGVGPGSPMPVYTVACVIVHSSQWVSLFEDLLRFRRYLSQSFGLRMREEVKANQLVNGGGPWTNLPYGDRVRKRIFRGFMRLQANVGTVKTFAVVIDKSKCATADDVRVAAWRHALERVESFARYNNNETVMLFPDEGNYHRFRRLSREMRRHSMVGSVFGGALARPLARYLIDDPVERDSSQSYMVQLADLNAYAAYRKEHPDPLFPATMWDELGPAILAEANSVFISRGGLENPGIIRGPR